MAVKFDPRYSQKMGNRRSNFERHDTPVVSDKTSPRNALSLAGVRTHELDALAAARAIILVEAQRQSPKAWKRLKRALNAGSAHPPV